MKTPSATLFETENGRGQPVLCWCCTACGEFLAAYFGKLGGERGALLRRGFIRLPSDREGIHAYGLAPRSLQGKSARAGRMGERTRKGRQLIREATEQGRLSGPRFLGPPPDLSSNPVRIPLVVYCPRRGVCGRAQVIEIDVDSVIMNGNMS